MKSSNSSLPLLPAVQTVVLLLFSATPVDVWLLQLTRKVKDVLLDEGPPAPEQRQQHQQQQRCSLGGQGALHRVTCSCAAIPAAHAAEDSGAFFPGSEVRLSRDAEGGRVRPSASACRGTRREGGCAPLPVACRSCQLQVVCASPASLLAGCRRCAPPLAALVAVEPWRRLCTRRASRPALGSTYPQLRATHLHSPSLPCTLYPVPCTLSTNAPFNPEPPFAALHSCIFFTTDLLLRAFAAAPT